MELLREAVEKLDGDGGGGERIRENKLLNLDNFVKVGSRTRDATYCAEVVLVLEGRTVLYLVFEYMDCESVMFKNIAPKIIKKIWIFSFQLDNSFGFFLLSEFDVPTLQGDLKKTMMLKIADLGLARAYTVPMKKYTHEILTLWYRAPEVLFGSISITSTVWTCAELVTNQALFPGDSELQQLLSGWLKLLGTPNEKLWPGVGKLVNWHEYPQWTAQPLSSAVPKLEEKGLHLLSVSFSFS
ncbi:hypothetical protein Leryth_019184 [Lithospermum erythrorhizon]|nr:hypothetical protein Leryth_019184 [Lithospermum erythrorhizon]